MRLFKILRHAVPLILSVLRDLKRWYLWGAPAIRSEAFHPRRAARVLASITQLGPSFVKLGQLFAGRTDLFPPAYAEAFNTLTDRVPPVPFEAIRASVERQTGQPLSATFESFDTTPLAAGSLGQVHRARWRGRDVAVKVLRPGVRELVATDIEVAGALASRVSRLMPNVHTRSLVAIIEEFERRIGDEMDFAIEAKNLIAVRANFIRNPRIRVPEAILELSGPDVLVMEYVTGTRIDALEAGRRYGGLTVAAVVERLQELYIQMMLIDGLFHADPHPGNVLVDEAGRIVLLDFGVVIQVDRTRRKELVDTIFAAIQNQVGGVVDGFYALGLVEPGANRAQIERLVNLLLDLAAQRTTSKERFELLTREVLQELYNWPIRLPSDLVYFARTSALIEGVGVRYDPSFDPIMSSGPLLWRMRGDLMRSLANTKAIQQLDWPVAVGYLLGRAAAKLTTAGEAIAGWFSSRTPRPTVPAPPQGPASLPAPAGADPAPTPPSSPPPS